MRPSYTVKPTSFWTALYSIGNESGEAIRCENCKRWVPRDRALFKRDEYGLDDSAYFLDTCGEVPPGYPDRGYPLCGPCSECGAEDTHNPDFIGVRLADELVRDVLYIEGLTPSDDPGTASE